MRLIPASHPQRNQELEEQLQWFLGDEAHEAPPHFEVGSPLSSSPRARNSVFYMPESDKGVDVASMFVRPLPGEVESLSFERFEFGGDDVIIASSD